MNALKDKSLWIVMATVILFFGGLSGCGYSAATLATFAGVLVAEQLCASLTSNRRNNNQCCEGVS